MPYAAPRSLEEAVALLRKNAGALPLAGGHALLLEPNRSRVRDLLLVDLRHVPNLAGITAVDGGLKIGAMTTLAEIAAHPTVRASYQVLAEVADTTGDAQLRNRATLGGSLAVASPENEFPAIALLLAATIDIAGKGARTIHADDFFSGKAVLGAGDIITAMTVPARIPRTGIAYVAHRNAATGAPVTAVGIGLAFGDDNTVTSTRAVLVGGTERPVRLTALEKQLTKSRRDAVMTAAAAAADGISLRSDLFASADYRAHLTRVLAARALKQALERAGG
jgi:carbon-monoxide dehydrogenase medium subunit